MTAAPLPRNEAKRLDALRSLLILDTHLLSNMLWSQALFDDCPTWLEEALLARRYDLHLLLSPQGVDWIADGQRCQPDLSDRQRFFDDSQAWLTRHNQPHQILDGNWPQRQLLALQSVAMLLGSDAPACPAEC